MTRPLSSTSWQAGDAVLVCTSRDPEAQRVATGRHVTNGRYKTVPWRVGGWVNLPGWLVTYHGGLPTCRWSPVSSSRTRHRATVLIGTIVLPLSKMPTKVFWRHLWNLKVSVCDGLVSTLHSQWRQVLKYQTYLSTKTVLKQLYVTTFLTEYFVFILQYIWWYLRYKYRSTTQSTWLGDCVKSFTLFFLLLVLQYYYQTTLGHFWARAISWMTFSVFYSVLIYITSQISIYVISCIKLEST